jgi:beta-barrel assembly-enhancing protease
LWKAGAAFAGVSAVALAVFLTAPTWLGPLVPESWERQMGEAMVGDFERLACHTPESDKAVAKLVGELDPGKQPVDVYIANIPIPNAVALPGGKILLFDGFLAQAESADEVAGVLGHEIGHVRERHVMQALLRQFGLSILLGGANSGLSDTLAGLADMSYSREAESAADEYSRERLAEANISPAGAASFFTRMRKLDPLGETETFGYLASHPSSAAREKDFNSAVEEGHTYAPALSPAEFDALQSACLEDEDVEEFGFF